jgi:hypothetical protein
MKEWKSQACSCSAFESTLSPGWLLGVHTAGMYGGSPHGCGFCRVQGFRVRSEGGVCEGLPSMRGGGDVTQIPLPLDCSICQMYVVMELRDTHRSVDLK